MEYEELNIKILENEQVLIEIEPNIWVDRDTYFSNEIRDDEVIPTIK